MRACCASLARLRGSLLAAFESCCSTWKPQLTAFLRWIRLMNSSFRAHGQGHLNGHNAPHPIEPRWCTPAALLLLALRSRQRRHLAGRSQARGLPSSRCPSVRGHTWSRSAQPCRPQSSQRLAFFALSRCTRAHLEPQRSPCRPQSSQRLAFFALSKCARAHLEPQRSPCRPQSSQRLAFFALSKCARAHLEPQRSALPAHPIAARSGAFNCAFQVQA